MKNAQASEKHTQALTLARKGWAGELRRAITNRKQAEAVLQTLEHSAPVSIWEALVPLIPLAGGLLLFQFTNLQAVFFLRQNDTDLLTQNDTNLLTQRQNDTDLLTQNDTDLLTQRQNDTASQPTADTVAQNDTDLLTQSGATPQPTAGTVSQNDTDLLTQRHNGTNLLTQNDTNLLTQRQNDTNLLTQRQNDTNLLTQNDTNLLTQRQNDTNLLTQRQNDTSLLTQNDTASQPVMGDDIFTMRKVARWLRNRCQEEGTWKALAYKLKVGREEICYYVNFAEGSPNTRRPSAKTKQALYLAFTQATASHPQAAAKVP